MNKLLTLEITEELVEKIKEAHKEDIPIKITTFRLLNKYKNYVKDIYFQ